MNFKKAINRINAINWEKLGSPDGDVGNLGNEYLKGMALFVYEQAPKHPEWIYQRNPLMVNAAKELGDTETVELEDYCNVDVEVLKNRSMLKYLLNCYLQLAKYSERNEEAKRYLDLYDPIIKLIEKGFEFGYREGGFMIYDSCYFYPLHGWYDSFLKHLKEDGLI